MSGESIRALLRLEWSLAAKLAESGEVSGEVAWSASILGARMKRTRSEGLLMKLGGLICGTSIIIFLAWLVAPEAVDTARNSVAAATATTFASGSRK